VVEVLNEYWRGLGDFLGTGSGSTGRGAKALGEVKSGVETEVFWGLPGVKIFVGRVERGGE
jgi:hypothetical protein